MGDAPPKDGAGLVAALAALETEMKPEVESGSKYRELMADAEKHLGKATGKYDERRKATKSLGRALKKLRKEGKATPSEVEDAQARLDGLTASLEELDGLRPTTGSVFVRLFLGQVNVRAATSKDRSKLRDEYNKFKDRTNMGFILFPCIWLATYLYLRHSWKYTHWIHILTHVWMLYYYVSLSLRENILKVNGSNIKNWWIYHHYLSSVMSITVLTWPPDSVSWDTMTPHLTAYFVYQGLVQVFQARYQKARHYARMAMGKAAHMDVAHTETLTEWHRGLTFIVVLVIVAQFWQLWLGWTMFRLLATQLNPGQPWYDFREEVQCAILGAMFLLLGLTNFTVTVITLLEKRQAHVRQAAAEARLRSSAAATAGSPPPPLVGVGSPPPAGAGSGAGGVLMSSARSRGPATPLAPLHGVGGSSGAVQALGGGAGVDSPLVDATLIAGSTGGVRYRDTAAASPVAAAAAPAASASSSAGKASSGGGASRRRDVPSLPVGDGHRPTPQPPLSPPQSHHTATPNLGGDEFYDDDLAEGSISARMGAHHHSDDEEDGEGGDGDHDHDHHVRAPLLPPSRPDSAVDGGAAAAAGLVR